MPDFIGDIRAVVINVLTELKETMIKEVKGIMTMSHQIDNIGQEREMYKKTMAENPPMTPGSRIQEV